MGLGTQVRLQWLVIAGYKNMLAGVGAVGERSDMLPLGQSKGLAGRGGWSPLRVDWQFVGFRGRLWL